MLTSTPSPLESTNPTCARSRASTSHRPSITSASSRFTSSEVTMSRSPDRRAETWESDRSTISRWTDSLGTAANLTRRPFRGGLEYEQVVQPELEPPPDLELEAVAAEDAGHRAR